MPPKFEVPPLRRGREIGSSACTQPRIRVGTEVGVPLGVLRSEFAAELECVCSPRPAQRVTVGELPSRVPIVLGETVIQGIGLTEAVVLP